MSAPPETRDQATAPPILRAKDIDALSVKRPHPVDKNAWRMQAALGDALGLHGQGIHKCALAPGCFSTTLHYHAQDSEWVYILSGSGVLVTIPHPPADAAQRSTTAPEEHNVAAGDFLGFPAGPHWARKLRAASDEGLVYLCGGTREPLDYCVYPQTPSAYLVDRRFPPGDPARNRWIGEKVDKDESRSS